MKQKILLALWSLLLVSGAWATDYTLTLYADGCDSPNTFICSSGQQLLVSATPMEHRHFVMWNDGNTDNPRLVTMTQDTAYTATFESDFKVFLTCSNGTIYGAKSYYKPNDTISLEVSPKSRYHFERWSDGVTDNPRTIIVTKDSAFSAECALDYEGYCGENLQWQYSNGLLTISGTGDMYDFSSSTMPWLLFRDSITNVVINEGATSIGDYAFYGCQNRAFTKLVMPQSVKTIGNRAFTDCNRLTSVVFSSELEEVGDYAFSGCTRINDMTCYADVTPDAYEHTFAGVNTMAYLYVQAGSARTYELDPYWGVFDIHEIGAESTTVTGNGVLVEPSDNEAVFTWPMSDGASTYALNITKDGVVFCTLTFNANGQLTNIAFAPARGEAANAPAATLTENGYQFTVTGLDYATNYAFSLDAKDAASQVVASYSGSFHTNGTTALDDLLPTSGVQKFFRDGQVLILRNGILYDATGRMVEK